MKLNGIVIMTLPSPSFTDIIRNFQEVSLVKQLIQSPGR